MLFPPIPFGRLAVGSSLYHLKYLILGCDYPRAFVNVVTVHLFLHICIQKESVGTFFHRKLSGSNLLLKRTAADHGKDALRIFSIGSKAEAPGRPFMVHGF